MGSNRSALYVLVTLFHFVYGSDPIPPQWPQSFNISFGSAQGSVPGKLYYDWTVKAQRIDHGAGAFGSRSEEVARINAYQECVNFYNATGPCSLLFNEQGVWSLQENFVWVHSSATDVGLA